MADNILHTQSTVDDCHVITLDKHHHANGNLSVVEDFNEIPFKIRRTYYLYDIPGGESRGGHAHKQLYQLIVAISGSFEVTIDDGRQQKTVTLNQPYNGLLIVPGIWRTLQNFSSGSVCAVLASEVYDEDDYYREYNEFLASKNTAQL
ncbi:MAG: WxcM-like domain-containing protein [Muribaculaceae bacterium]|nr:WxcM-like domain-containing protein [Muribaculaceae bacterium]